MNPTTKQTSGNADADLGNLLEGESALKDEDILLQRPMAANSQLVLDTFTRGYNVLAQCRNDLWRAQCAAFAQALALNDDLRHAFVSEAAKTITSQQSCVQGYAHNLQRHVTEMWQVGLGAWGSLGEALVPAAEKTRAASSAMITTPRLPEAAASVRRSSKHEGDGQDRRASTA